MSMNFLYLDPFKRYKLPKSIPVFKAANGKAATAKSSWDKMRFGTLV